MFNVGAMSYTLYQYYNDISQVFVLFLEFNPQQTKQPNMQP